ncbi:MAG: hypothetical protein ACOVQJ_09365 [Bacteroidia bacterium]|jgi:hypothetical protein
MKNVTLIVLLVFLFTSCEDNQIERNWNRLEGKWKVNRAWLREDNARVLRNNNNRDAWKIEFKADSTFVLITDKDTLEGNYHSRLTQIQFEFTQPSPDVEKPRLWYYVSVNRNSIEAMEMIDDGEFEYLWRREK